MDLPADLRRTVDRYGGAPLLRRTLEDEPRRVAALRPLAGGSLGGVGLVWNSRGRVALVRHEASTGWGPEWATPGGMAEPGETPEETFAREVEEETGVRLREILDLTYVFDLTVTDGREAVRGFLFQFEGLAEEGPLRPGTGIAEGRWFDALPEDMAFREDYEEAFRHRARAGGSLGRESDPERFI